jgi:hypothetical protein
MYISNNTRVFSYILEKIPPLFSRVGARGRVYRVEIESELEIRIFYYSKLEIEYYLIFGFWDLEF